MKEVNSLVRLDEEVQRLADEQAPELLPRLYAELFKREGLQRCKRHSLLRERIKAEVMLTKVKRSCRFRSVGESELMDLDGRLRPNLAQMLERTIKIRKEYRSHPCTCWVPHR